MDRIWVSGWGCVALAMTLLVLPLPWVAAAVLAAAVHELCHYLAIAALGGQVGRIAVGSGGAAMELGCLSPVRELLAAAAGPVGSLHTIGHLCQLSALYRAHNGGHCADQHKQVQFQKAPHVCPTFNNLLINEIRNCPVGIQQTGLKILGHGDCPIQPVSPHRSSPASARSQ